MKNLPVAIPETAQGRIITSVGGLYTVETFSGICTCKARGIFRKRGITPYVGDYVQLSEDGVIQEILPRKNSILRPPVSNLDQIFFVVSTCHPAPNLLLLDSFLTVAIYQDIQPAVVLTKMDLHRGEQLEKLYTDAGIPVYPVEYGKHTTRQVQLYPCAGGYLADTPGFSTFEVEQYLQMDKERIADCFPEFQPYLGQCRFSDCAHVCEKGCAVVEAVQAGKISKSRHDAYVSLYQTAKQRKAWES